MDSTCDFEEMLVKMICPARFFGNWKLSMARFWVSFPVFNDKGVCLHSARSTTQVEAERLELLKVDSWTGDHPLFGSVLCQEPDVICGIGREPLENVKIACNLIWQWNIPVILLMKSGNSNRFPIVRIVFDISVCHHLLADDICRSSS